MMRNDLSLLTPPWDAGLVQRLNLAQVGLGDWPAHPYTCANRGDGRHGDEGGDRGVLIATEQGWVCPHCTYAQAWAHAASGEIYPTAIVGQSGIEFFRPPQSVLLARLDGMLAAYRDLQARHATGAEVMVQVLEARRAQLLAPPAVFSLWVIYDRPSDFPTEVVARRFDLKTEQPTQDLLRAPTLVALRAQQPADATVLPRQKGDDPVIVESWLVETPP
jgi:hypothetical protein